MTIDKWIFYTGGLVMLLMAMTKPQGKTRVIVMVIFFLLIFAPYILPSFLFGRWNSIKELKTKSITAIIIKPYWVPSDINLSDTMLQVTNPDQVQHIKELLQNATIYRAGHSSDIWQASVILVTAASDSLKMHISKTTNQGTHVHKDDNNDSYNQDELGDYLQKITGFTIREN